MGTEDGLAGIQGAKTRNQRLQSGGATNQVSALHQIDEDEGEWRWRRPGGSTGERTVHKG